MENPNYYGDENYGDFSTEPNFEYRDTGDEYIRLPETPVAQDDRWRAELNEIVKGVYLRDMGIMCHAVICGCASHKAEAKKIGEYWKSPVPSVDIAKVYLDQFPH